MKRTRDAVDVVVVGAGLVGSALALGLARSGRRVAVLEQREPAPWDPARPGLRVVALAADAVSLFERLGVWASMPADGTHAYRGMRVWDAAGGGELVLDADELGQPQLGWIVSNDLLAWQLWTALEREPLIQRIPHARVTGLEQEADRAGVELDDGRRLRAPLVVAADGAGSTVRQLAGIEVTSRDYGQRGLVAFLRSERDHQDIAWQRFLPGGPLALLPVRDGRCSIVWSLPEDEAMHWLQAPEPAFLDALTRAADARLGAFSAVSERAAFPLRRQLAREYVAGRVVLVGDAAHTVHPLAGQGVNLGLRDVACLLRLVESAGVRDIGAPHRLARYQRERRGENLLAAWAFEGIHRVFANDALLPTLVRGPALGLANHVPGLRRQLWRHAAGLG